MGAEIQLCALTAASFSQCLFVRWLAHKRVFAVNIFYHTFLPTMSNHATNDSILKVCPSSLFRSLGFWDIIDGQHFGQLLLFFKCALTINLIWFTRRTLWKRWLTTPNVYSSPERRNTKRQLTRLRSVTYVIFCAYECQITQISFICCFYLLHLFQMEVFAFFSSNSLTYN